MKSINEEKTSEDSSHNSFQFSVTFFLTKSDLRSVCKLGDQIHQGLSIHHYVWHLCKKAHRVMEVLNLAGLYLETIHSLDERITKLFHWIFLTGHIKETSQSDRSQGSLAVTFPRPVTLSAGTEDPFQQVPPVSQHLPHLTLHTPVIQSDQISLAVQGQVSLSRVSDVLFHQAIYSWCSNTEQP